MAQSKTNSGRISKAKALELEKTQEAEAQRQLDRQKKIRRLLWDLAGLFLLVVGAILLLAALGVTHGKLVDSSVATLKRWFGWGRFLVAAAVFLGGWVLLVWRKNPPESFNVARLLMVELGLFLLLGVFSAFANDSVLLINSGNSAGGIVGFGLAYPLRSLIGNFPTGILLALIALILLLLGFRLSSRIERWAKGGMSSYQAYPQVFLEDKASAVPHDIILDEPGSTQTVRVKKKRVAGSSPQMELPLAFRQGGLKDNNQPAKEVKHKPRPEQLPPLGLLDQEKIVVANQGTINMNAAMLEKTLGDFGVPAKVIGYRVGPTVTQYAVEPGYFDKGNTEEKQKVRISQISGLSKDLALALKAERLRIEAPVPGESYVGVEVPNSEQTVVRLKPLLESPEFAQMKSPLSIPLGRGVSGQPVISDLASMPHLMIAGTTNSGKSVCIAALTTALVMNNHPDDLKLVMVDPKLVELKRFNGLPHLLGEVETNIERIMAVLRWAVTEMNNRYRLLEILHVRNLDTYNQKADKLGKPRMPRIILLIDELADLMLSAPDETENAIVSLAQKSRAVGIHLVVATQRPSTDVVTGVIKANFPTRIAFTVASSVDSRVILDYSGAETLLGRGDLLFLHPEVGHPQRAQGVMVSDHEIHKVIDWWQKQVQLDQRASVTLVLPETDQDKTSKTPRPVVPVGEAIVEEEVPWEEEVQNQPEDDGDEGLIRQATELVRVKRRASASYLQRHLRLGYPRAAWLIDQLESRGVLGPPTGARKEREILIPEPDETEDAGEE
ncbi:MAG: DNA translocase FtsK [Anaerolineaceae bacterium]|nr:DNA translocase FtsK [Anaerolineaceae bacterium]